MLKRNTLFTILTDRLDFKELLTGESVCLVILRRCSSLRGRLEGQGRIRIRGWAGLSWVDHCCTKQNDIGFRSISGFDRDSGRGVVYRVVVVVQRSGTDGWDCTKSVQCHEQAKQNGRTPHVGSLAHKHKLNET